MDEKPSTAVEKDEYAAPVAASEKELDEEKTEIVTGGESTDSAGSTSGRLPRGKSVGQVSTDHIIVLLILLSPTFTELL